MDGSYEQRLSDRILQTGSNLCVGLDPRPESIDGDVYAFLERVVEETLPVAAAFKPNIAYFEALGPRGYAMLEKLIAHIGNRAPVILDAKRGDIPETQKHYARAYFENWKVDAVTVNPYMGFDSIEPYLAYEGKGIYLLGVTSNPGAEDIQLKKTVTGRLFEKVLAMKDRATGMPGSFGWVMGLTQLNSALLEQVAGAPLLVPGLGAQGGEPVPLGAAAQRAPVLVNVSRGILFSDPEKSFREKAHTYAKQIKEMLAI